VSLAQAGRARALAARLRPRWGGWHAAERSARLWSGIVLLVFALTHFLNHSIGVFGVAAMTVAQEWRSDLWRSWPGAVLIYGALALHAALSLKRAAARRTWRMSWHEALQILLGLLIPILLLSHVVSTRFVGGPDYDVDYVHVLRNLWPGLALSQSLALVVVWTHGALGLYYAFHVRSWFRPLRTPFVAAAVLVPVLALAGFVAAGREARTLPAPQQAVTDEHFAQFASAIWIGKLGIGIVLAAAAAAVSIRFLRGRLGRRLTIRYMGHGEVSAAPGQTLLEISRANRIPHPSACGGRGRCSSCRVLVIAGEGAAAPPSGLERRMLDRIRAPGQVRLACQLRPTGDLSVRVLLAADELRGHAGDLDESLDWGVEGELTVFVADMRGFSTLARGQLPADLIVLLNRVMGEMAQAVQARGGRIALVQTDGMMAVFGAGGRARTGARAALNAAADLLKAMHLINKDIRAALPLPIRVGIGIHTGEAILSRAEDGAGQRLVVIGETVAVAYRLEEATKELAADCVASARTLAAAGLSASAEGERTIHYKHGETPVQAHAFADRQELRALLGRIATPREARSRPQTASTA